MIAKIYEAMEAASAAGLPKEQPTGAKDGARVACNTSGLRTLSRPRGHLN